MRSIKFEILGKPWTARVFSAKRFDALYGHGNAANTEEIKRRIDLRSPDVNIEIIRHEIWHAYKAEICTSSANLPHEAFEEISADLFAKRGDEMLALSAMLDERVREII